jgi:hypothetical protein
MTRAWIIGTLLATASLCGAFGQQDAKVSDFQWMAGNWTANVDGRIADRSCSQVAGESMTCMLRVIADGKAIWLEYSVLRATPNGVVLDTRFFSGDMQPAPPVSNQLRLRSATSTTWTFENPTGTQPRTETITRDGPQSMTAHADLIDAQGKSSSVDAKWQKVP